MTKRRGKFLKYVTLFVITFTVSVLVELSLYIDWPNYTRYKEYSTDAGKQEQDDFLEDWCRLQNWRYDWEEFLAPCAGQLDWDKRQVNSVHRSDAGRSFIKSWALKPAGEISQMQNDLLIMLCGQTECFLRTVQISHHCM